MNQTYEIQYDNIHKNKYKKDENRLQKCIIGYITQFLFGLACCRFDTVLQNHYLYPKLLMIVISIKSGFHFKSGSFSPIPNIEDGDNLG